jgi:hypothetical protein
MPYPAQANAIDLRLTSAPAKIYIEQSMAGQILNFDFIVQNLTERKWRIKHIEVSVHDARGKLVARKFIDESGSIQTIPNREVQGNTSILIFNPFFLFDHHVDLHTLRYTIMLTPLTSDGQDEADEKVRILETTILPEQYATQTELHLPVRERVLIWDGHDFYSHHRRFYYLHPMLQHFGFKTNFQRYGYDFVPVNEEGEMFRDNYEDNEEWFGFGRPVYATATGRVADFFDGMPDNRAFNEMEIATREMVLFGNYVILDHDNGEFSCFAHLKQGSIRVTKGQEILQGQMIGSIGASGSSLFPHLHYELRDGLGAKDVEGLPSYFYRFRRKLGSKSIEVQFGQIDTGEFVEPF